MRVKFLTLGMTLVLAIALVTELSPVTVLSQDNTNQSNSNSSRRRRGRRPRPPATQPAEQTPPEATPATETPAAEATPRRRTRRRTQRGGAMGHRGVPTGVQNCIDHLIEMASADPLVAYEGHPSEVVNNGLMWNDPKSKCSVGTDPSLRLKVSNMATAWTLKDAAKVRSLLQEIKSTAPQ
jgi:hypothetical protein